MPFKRISCSLDTKVPRTTSEVNSVMMATRSCIVSAEMEVSHTGLVKLLKEPNDLCKTSAGHNNSDDDGENNLTSSIGQEKTCGRDLDRSWTLFVDRGDVV